MMRIIFKALSIMAFSLASFLLFTGWMTNDDFLVRNTIKNNHVLNSNFQEASLFVADFVERNGRLPLTAEFAEWTNKFSLKAYSPHDMRIKFSEFPAETLSKLGFPNSNLDNYMLIQSDGNEEKYWASWSRKSTASEDPANFYIFGGKTADQIFYGASALLAIIVALLLWRFSNRTD